jgi:DNA (cytosine-5)-methyltransferase 1
MTHGSLFSGIGGAELAASWMGWTNVFHCEINKYNQKLLKQHFPESISYEDIKTTGFIQHRGSIDILTGGFPCQPFSAAGKRKGTADDRHLWPEMLRAIREIQPRWIVGENVRGLTNWNGGLVFDQVQADMEAEGYEIIPFLFPACAVNAPHRRDRIWFIAHSDCYGHQSGGFAKNRFTKGESEGDKKERKRVRFNTWGTCEQGIASDSERERFEKYWNENKFKSNPVVPNTWWSNQSDVRRRNDGIPNWVDRIKGLGNAWVPQAALQIFKAIQEYENLQP